MAAYAVDTKRSVASPADFSGAVYGNLVVGDSEGYLHWINVEDVVSLPSKKLIVPVSRLNRLP